jgi:hypothetical protein
MAEKNPTFSPQDAENLAKLQTDIERTNQRIEEQNKRMATARLKDKRALEEMMKLEDKKLKALKDQTKALEQAKNADEKRVQDAEDLVDLQEDLTSSFEGLSNKAKKLISTQKLGAASLASLGEEIILAKQQEQELEGSAKVKAADRLKVLQDQYDSYVSQAEESANAQRGLFGGLQIDKQRYEFEKSIAKLSKEQQETLRGVYEQEEKLAKIQERYNELQEKSSEMFEELPEPLQKIYKGITAFAGALKAMAPELLVLGAIGLAAEAFFELDEAAEEYRKTGGMTAKQTEQLAHEVHEIEMDYRKIGVDSKLVFDIANDLGNTFSDIAHFSKETLGAMSAVVARTGTSTENAAKVQAIFEQTAGVTSETAANLQMQVASLSQQAGVSPKEVLDDIANSAETTSKFFKGDVNLLKQQAIQAHRLGTTLDKMAATSEKLLDFESGIEEELTAATFVGGQFNLSRARALAMEGKLAEAQEETLNQIQRSGDFSKQDYFTQQQLAKAAGMSTEEITKQLGMRKKLEHLSASEKAAAEAAMKAGLDISDIKEEDLKRKTEEFAEQQKINGQVTDLSNQFKGIVATVGGALMPVIKSLAPVIEAIMIPLGWAADILKFMVEHFTTIASIASIIAGISAIIYANELKTWYLEKQKLITTVAQGVAEKTKALFSLQGAAATEMGSLAQVPFGVGLLGAAAVIGGMIALFHSIGDGAFPASGGGAMISTKEGGLFKTSENDDIAVGPGILQPRSGGKGNGGGMGAVVNAIAGLRNDMAGGKIGVYMDGARVTAGVAGNANQSTRNNYAFT